MAVRKIILRVHQFISHNIQRVQRFIQVNPGSGDESRGNDYVRST